MKIIRNFVLALLILVFALNGAVGLIGYGFSQKLLVVDTYKESFAETDFYGTIYQKVNAALEKQFSLLLKGSTLFGHLVTESWVKDQTDAVTEGLLAYVKGERQQLPVISYKEIKTEIGNRLQKMGIDGRLTGFVLNPLPDTVNLTAFISPEDLEPFKEIVRLLEEIPTFSGIVAAAVWVIMVLISGGFRRGKGWISMSLLVTGIFCVFVGIFVSSYGIQILARRMAVESGGFLAPGSVERLIQSLMRGAGNPAITGGLAASILGVFLRILPIAKHDKVKQQTEN